MDNKTREYLHLLTVKTIEPLKIHVIDKHFINSSTIDMPNSENACATIDSSIGETCKDTTALKRKKIRTYVDFSSSWGQWHAFRASSINAGIWIL